MSEDYQKSQRLIAAENAWDTYDFGEEVIVGVNGWENVTPDIWKRVFFVERKGDNSQRMVFWIEFCPFEWDFVIETWLSD